MSIRITDLQQGVLALMGDDGSITINAKHLQEFDELLHDQNGQPSLTAYYAAQDDYYTEVF